MGARNIFPVRLTPSVPSFLKIRPALTSPRTLLGCGYAAIVFYEAYFSETGFCKHEIRFTLKNLKKWMKSQRQLTIRSISMMIRMTGR